MLLHEYQSKQLFKEYGLPVLNGRAIESPLEVAEACRALGGSRWVVKAQVHAGGRGKAGGVIIAQSPQEAEQFAERWLGKRLVTHQTGAEGQPVNRILLEPAATIDRELYLGAVVDRSSQRVVFMASSEGGMDIEEVARTHPERIFSTTIDPLTDAQPWQARTLGYQLGLNNSQLKQFCRIFTALARLFAERDLSLVEINPLVICNDGELCCLDAKINVDSNALFRQPDIEAMNDTTQDDPREVRAAEWSLNYVALEGNIGCMVNGAGLAMGVMDTIKLNGGRPANFLDVGGGTTRERVAEAFKIILSDQSVKVVLVNIFGGIVRCDLIAEGIIGAIKEIDLKVPVIVRLEGTHAAEGKRLLDQSGMDIIASEGLEDAAQRAVALAGGSSE
ncbi:ADP-forming succinate--CoA ligase subunit beta [Carnimonas nigrificans]|uniref:ADP-forming succinate--CoA ligase subunit beta n=1 Tax=Carnimonas nigrificans TaxID=64323 RepID=UPI00047184E9|nr:ADP-forming succinate--CoA ligase subunit beta [Carnimonas nigrificans]